MCKNVLNNSHQTSNHLMIYAEYFLDPEGRRYEAILGIAI